VGSLAPEGFPPSSFQLTMYRFSESIADWSKREAGVIDRGYKNNFMRRYFHFSPAAPQCSSTTGTGP
jgi:hypothetical protein